MKIEVGDNVTTILVVIVIAVVIILVECGVPW
jgi:hypothetical protein